MSKAVEKKMKRNTAFNISKNILDSLPIWIMWD